MKRLLPLILLALLLPGVAEAQRGDRDHRGGRGEARAERRQHDGDRGRGMDRRRFDPSPQRRWRDPSPRAERRVQRPPEHRFVRRRGTIDPPPGFRPRPQRPPPGFRAPPGRNYGRGQFIPRELRGPPMVDYRRYRLRRPPQGYNYYRRGAYVYLISDHTGMVFEVVPLAR